MILNRLFRKIRTSIFLHGLKEKGKYISLFFPLTIEGKSNVSIGSNTGIGSYVHIRGGGGVKIGSNVLIAAHCCITSLGHNYHSSKIREGSMISKSVSIEDDVWLGYNVTVLPGVTIGKGSVIGAGSVVCSDIPPYSIAVGNPAKVIKRRIM